MEALLVSTVLCVLCPLALTACRCHRLVPPPDCGVPGAHGRAHGRCSANACRPEAQEQLRGQTPQCRSCWASPGQISPPLWRSGGCLLGDPHRRLDLSVPEGQASSEVSAVSQQTLPEPEILPATAPQPA